LADVSHTLAAASPRAAQAAPLTALTDVPLAAWDALASRAVEPNAYQLGDWQQAIAASARGGAGAQALAAWQNGKLIGTIPVQSLWRAFRVPLPGLVNVDPHNSLGTPLFDREHGVAAVHALLRDARRAGAHALLLRHVTIAGPMMATLQAALAQEGLKPVISDAHARAFLDATREAETLLREDLSSTRLKQMRRLRNRLAEQGDVTCHVARDPDEIAAALPAFLDLEASGWKGARGTALKQHAGNLAFIRRATQALAARGQCEIVTLRVAEKPVAAGIVLRHLGRAYYFKIGVDPAYAKMSVGVQLTIELTRHLCADPAIDSADSTADPGHPMIDPIWRGRLAIGDVLVPLRRYDPLFPLIRVALDARRALRRLAMKALRR
jgi:CelD/BcsL family acetyltransferase involved in cellulose biosynthesis